LWFEGDEYEGLGGGYSMMDGVIRDPDGDVLRSRPRSKPAMEALPVPVDRGWGKAEWMAWKKEVDSYFKMLNTDSWSDTDFNRYHKQKKEAIKWAVIDKMTIVFVLPGGEETAIECGSEQRMQDAVDEFCRQKKDYGVPFQWELFHWLSASKTDFENPTPEVGSVEYMMKQRPWDYDLFMTQYVSRKISSLLWRPIMEEDWEDATRYRRYIYLVKKKASPAPDAPPPMNLLDAEGTVRPNADWTAQEWKAWECIL